MAVGNVQSTERGSGARYNDGKPDLSLIPLTIIAASFPAGDPVRTSLNLLGLFQTTGDGERLREALEAVNYSWRSAAKVFEYGKKKYAAWNWAKGMAWSVPLACAGRHALAMLEGEQDDPESGLPHLGHYIANLVMLAHFVRWFPEGNDLPPPELFRVPGAVSRHSDVESRHSGPVSRHSPAGFEEVLAASSRADEGMCGYCKDIPCACDIPGSVRATFPPFNAKL